VTSRKTNDREARDERARRLDKIIEKGPRPPKSPHEFVEERMREEKQKKRPSHST